MKTLNATTVIASLGQPYFRELSTFGALPDDIVRELLEGGDIFQLEKGDVLYRVGDRAAGFYVVLQGSLAAYFEYEGQEALALHHRRGEELGVVAMIGLHDRAATTVASEDSTVVHISSDQFYSLHEQDPEAFGMLMLNLSREMAREVRRYGELVVQLRMQIQKLMNDHGEA